MLLNRSIERRKSFINVCPIRIIEESRLHKGDDQHYWYTTKNENNSTEIKYLPWEQNKMNDRKEKF